MTIKNHLKKTESLVLRQFLPEEMKIPSDEFEGISSKKFIGFQLDQRKTRNNRVVSVAEWLRALVL